MTSTDLSQSSASSNEDKNVHKEDTPTKVDHDILIFDDDEEEEEVLFGRGSFWSWSSEGQNLFLFLILLCVFWIFLVYFGAKILTVNNHIEL